MDKILYQGEWVQVILRDGWYEFAKAVSSQGVCYILPYRTNGNNFEILGRYENTPAHEDGIQLTSITGGLPVDMTVAEAAAREMYEEAGYMVKPDELTSLGTVRLSKMTDTIAYMFAIDVTNKERREAPGDGTKGEADAYCDWVTMKEALLCKDPVMAAMIVRVARENGNH